MLPRNPQDTIDSNVEFAFERPVGWSSACLDSTIDYYLHCNDQDLFSEESSSIDDYRS